MKKLKQGRKTWFRGLKAFLKIFIRKPKFVFLGDVPQENSIILSNHVGASAPVNYELYFPQPFRFWGTYEMTMGLKSTYKYLSTTYLHQKKHYNKYLAKCIAFIICPFVNMFYKGLRLIPTYNNYRLRSTIRESVSAIKNGEKLIIFPEDSSKGYFDNLTSFFAGFVLLAKICLKQGIDLTVYASYYVKEKRTFIFDKGTKFSELLKLKLPDKKLAEKMCNRANELRELFLKGSLQTNQVSTALQN